MDGLMNQNLLCSYKIQRSGKMQTLMDMVTTSMVHSQTHVRLLQETPQSISSVALMPMVMAMQIPRWKWLYKMAQMESKTIHNSRRFKIIPFLEMKKTMQILIQTKFNYLAAPRRRMISFAFTSAAILTTQMRRTSCPGRNVFSVQLSFSSQQELNIITRPESYDVNLRAKSSFSFSTFSFMIHIYYELQLPL